MFKKINKTRITILMWRNAVERGGKGVTQLVIKLQLPIFEALAIALHMRNKIGLF